jgi:GTP-binding protein
VSLYYEPNLRAGRGSHGQGKDKHGRNGEPLTVKVPVGTMIFRLPELFHPHMADPGPEETGKKASLDLRTLEPLADLDKPDAQFVLCRGGRGGKGNTHFKSSTNRAPRRTTDGESGEEGWFALELRTIADAGLVGYPNAGKSTLLGRISAAHPKVAPYPFTTLNPVVGVVELGGYRRATVADIPGLIEGAHNNKGLGHEFLRHIERCKLLLFVIDMAGSEARDPIEDFRTLRRELKLYDPALAARPFAVVANKMDLPEAASHLRQFKAKARKATVLPVCANKGEGIDQLRELFAKVLAPKTS